jgi:hypothetical protein
MQKELAASNQAAATTRPPDHDDAELKQKIEDMLIEEKVYAVLEKNARISEVKKPFGETAQEVKEEL